MKLKLNKKKMKSLSSDNKAIPAEMTPQVAGGQDVNSSFVTYRCGGGGGRLTMDYANTCGIGYTCPDVY
ncbi:hypothetical protein [Pseudoalteromonas phenolica]|uniref:Uncharacterized protein n=1 Tax=Pseudoalteromonas phenolica TaxID=161398 RepID=A0A0S2K6C2_9GAMM|nr:hypothetical protein [Pseudoalteromonas phenolica]ALO43805.1 hypothetical protein PP2015_3330 [Pseudoalteromonas phenolica]MBE0355018.1 hypothetical protein [Pseudoalteromonas phenolica O-BC30]RXE97279.1 hypothetical protein D9981_10800 [Pseudoalteromonas phenolica O-BC30]